ncbi:MAG TPA: hypothetical protein VKP78_02125 [bacterium]|nr:hypothetical protein [bacterium]
MKDLNLAGPSGFQRPSDKERNIPSGDKINTQHSPEEAETRPPIRKIVLALMSIAILVIAFTFVYQNIASKSHKKSQEQSSVVQKEKQEQTQSSLRQQDVAEIPNHYQKEIAAGKNVLELVKQTMPVVPNETNINDIKFEENQIKASIWFFDKKSAWEFKEQIADKLQIQNIDKYDIKKKVDRLPYRWEVVLSAITKKQSQSFDNNLQVLSDRAIGDLLSKNMKSSRVLLSKFVIANPNKNEVRGFRVEGEGKAMNISAFCSKLYQNNINLSYEHINFESQPESDQIHFTIRGNIYPGK